MEFKKYRIGQLGKVVTGKTPSTRNLDNWSGEFPFITIPDLNNSPYIRKSARTLSQLGAASIQNQLLPANTVLMSCIATVGKCGITTKPSFTNQQINAVIPNSLIEPKFMYYLFRNLGAEMARFGSGGTVYLNISKSLFESMEVSIPTSIEMQAAISSILEVLDSKIENNQALSKTLEDIAQTIFKSWFIDFDPVKAKTNGEKPIGMDDQTAALLPDSFEESEIGLIPKGWNVHSLDEISDYLNGLAMQRFPVTDEENQLPVIKIAQLRAGNTSGADIASGLIDSRFVIKDGDILFSWSGTLEVETWAGGAGALNQHLFKVSGKTVPDWFSYLSTKYFLTFFRQIASSKATTMGHIQRSHLSESKIALPSKVLMKRVSELLEPLITKKVNSLIESRTLAEIRDSLLPRLISGELEIPEEMLAS